MVHSYNSDPIWQLQSIQADTVQATDMEATPLFHRSKAAAMCTRGYVVRLGLLGVASAGYR